MAIDAKNVPSGPINPGEVAWTGENPGIYLKAQPDGDWTGLATFFRIMWSPHGRGHGVLLLDRPLEAKGLPAVRNFCISDNEPLARYLVAEFFSKFMSFRASPGTGAISYLPLTKVSRGGDSRSTYTETIDSADFSVVMTWRGLGQPYAVDMPPEKGPTKQHQMYSLFVDASDAGVTVNGTPLAGRVAVRDFADTKKPTAFLAFSETWIKVS